MKAPIAKMPTRQDRDDGRAPPPVRRRFDQRVGQPGEREHGPGRAGRIDAAGVGLVDRLGHVAPADHQHRERERQVDHEDPAPRRDVEQVAADQRTGGAGQPAEARPRPDRPRLGHRRRTTPAGSPGCPASAARRRCPARPARRSGRAHSARSRTPSDATANQMTPSSKISPPPHAVAERAAEQQERGQRQRVRGDHPLQAGDAGVEVLADVRQRDCRRRSHRARRRPSRGSSR